MDSITVKVSQKKPQEKRMYFLLLLLGAVVSCSLVIIFSWEILQGQMSRGINVFLGVLFFFLLFFLEYLIRSHMVFYILTTVLLLLSPILGLRMPVEVVLLLFLLQLSFWSFQAAGGKRKSAVTFQLAGKSGIAVFFAALLISGMSLLVAAFYAENLYDFIYETEGFINRSMLRLSGRADDAVTNGEISLGNNYRTGTPQLELIAVIQPTEVLYLRGFSGGDYLGGDWKRSSDPFLFTRMEDDIEWLEWINTLNTMYYNMYFMMNRTTAKEQPEPIQLTIRYCDDIIKTTYTPYYSRNTGSIYVKSDTPEGKLKGYVYLYYEQKDMHLDRESRMADSRYWDIQSAYMAQIQDAYTRVPTERLPRLTALVEENPFTELNDITAFILYTLQNNASYSLTPGWAAWNQDIVEYFLFERKAGFCEHFATAAVLMYRLYGVPARYAAGYQILPSDFILQEDGSYQAIVTDEASHAWVEIFLEDYGWTPVEVTPSAAGSPQAHYPGFDGSLLPKIWEERGWETEVLGSSKTAVNDPVPSYQINMNVDGNQILVMLIFLLYAVLLLWLFFEYRRWYLLEKAAMRSGRAHFTRLLELLHFSGVMPEYDGSEADFALRLSSVVPDISQEAAEQLVDVVSKAAFSALPPNDEEEAFVCTQYRHAADFLYTGLPQIKKWIFKYIMVFG